MFTIASSTSSTVWMHSVQTFSMTTCGGKRLNPRLTERGAGVMILCVLSFCRISMWFAGLILATCLTWTHVWCIQLPKSPAHTATCSPDCLHSALRASLPPFSLVFFLLWLFFGVSRNSSHSFLVKSSQGLGIIWFCWCSNKVLLLLKYENDVLNKWNFNA